MYDENDCNRGPEESGCGGYEQESGHNWRENLKYMVFVLLAIFVLVGIFLWPSYHREAKAEPYLIEASTRIKQAIRWKAVGEFSSAENELKKAAENMKLAQAAFGQNKNWKEIDRIGASIARVAALTRAEAGKLWEKIKDRRDKLLELPD